MPRPRSLLAGLLLLLTGCGPALLSGADSLSRFSPPPPRVATGVAYGEEPRQKLDVYAPKGDAESGARPVVVFFYGGAWAEGARGGYAFAGRAFASKGFVTVVPDYRLVPQVRFPAFVQDGAAAIRWVRDNISKYGGDPNRITIAGHSAGAHIGAMLALDRRWLQEAGVDPKTIRAGALLAGPYDFLPLTDRRSSAALGNWPRPEETQPLTFARADAPPLWLATGTLDKVVRPRNSEVLARRLRSFGAPAEFKQYQGAGHTDLALGLAKPFRGRLPVLDDAATFLQANSR
ncbi:MAG TPA: alpha/beta hydrolase [Sphingomonas sp.]